MGPGILDKTIDIVEKSLPFLGNSIKESRMYFGDQFERIGEELCSSLFSVYGKDELRYEQAVKGYTKFCVEHLLLQKELEKSGHYRHDDFDKVNCEIYGNPEVMDGYYLTGLFLSTIFWPNHLKMFLFFLDKFVKDIPDAGKCYEIGVGHGLLISSLLKERPDLKVWGVDISAPALIFAEKLLSGRGIDKHNYELRKSDIRAGIVSDDSAYDAVICAEVIEHLDKPQILLKEIARILKDGGKAYITTAIFAASIDHIYLFESEDEAKEMIVDSGLKIKYELILPVYGNKPAGDKRAPLNFACIAEKPVPDN